jgi:hypothetical protein
MTAIFARITAQHDALAFSITPCARLLYRFLLRARPAGNAIEFWVKDFNEFVANYRRRPFCKRWIKKAIAQLEQIGLVKIITRYSHRCLKLVALHPGQIDELTDSDLPPPGMRELVQTVNKNSTLCNKNSTKTTSNPYSAVPTYRDNLENNKPVVVKSYICSEGKEPKQDGEKLSQAELVYEHPEVDQTTSTNPVGLGEETFSAAPTKTLEPQCNQDLVNKAEDLGVRLTPYLIRLITQSSAEVVKNALDALSESRREGKAKNPSGYLVQAIKQRWQPKQAKHPSETFPDGFLVAYGRLIDQGIVEDLPPRYLPRDRNHQPMVRVKTPGGLRPYELRPWREVI